LEKLSVSRVSERGPTEPLTEEAFEKLEEAMKRGEIATIAQARIGSSSREGSSYAMLTPRTSERF
jgi:hypothetical protein